MTELELYVLNRRFRDVKDHPDFDGSFVYAGQIWKYLGDFTQYGIVYRRFKLAEPRYGAVYLSPDPDQ